LRRVTGHQVASTTHLSRSIPADHSTNLATAIMEPLSCSTSGLYFLYVLSSADASNSLRASNNDPPPDTNSPRSTQTRHLPDGGLAGEQRSLGVQAGRRSGFRLKPGRTRRVRWQTVCLRVALHRSTFCSCFSCFCPSQLSVSLRDDVFARQVTFVQVRRKHYMVRRSVR
jgi:hypothetical protein